jgi:hypothetical protein
MLLLLLVLLPVAAILWHDLWIEAEPFMHKRPGPSRIRLGSGEIFRKSEQAPNPERFATLRATTLAGTGEVVAEFGQDENFRTFEYAARGHGPHWLAVATKPQLITLSAEKFNEYLAHDGLGNVLEDRKRRGIAGNAEVEEYRKCARALIGVGELETADYRISSGLELELCIACRPEVGQQLAIEVKFQGKFLPGFIVQAGRVGGPRVLCDDTSQYGVAFVRVDEPGRWYLRGIHMLEVHGKPHHYESIWASTTFEV